MPKHTIKALVASVIVIPVVTFFSVAKPQYFSKDLLVPTYEGKTVEFAFDEIHQIVQDPLVYLGHGAEAIAFVSKDDQYVVKFFLQSRLFDKSRFKPKARLRQLMGQAKRIERCEYVLKRYETGLKELKDETAMLAVHHFKSKEKLPICTIIDRDQKEHTIDLNHVAFVVQKKCQPLNKNMMKNQTEYVDQKVEELFSQLANKGFVNLSGTFFLANFAILDDKAVMIDLGKLEYAPEKAYEKEEKKFMDRYNAKKKRL